MNGKEQSPIPPIEAPMILFTSKTNRPYWIMPSRDDWQIMTPYGNQMLVMPIPPDILTQIYEYIQSKPKVT